jgi:hypothetical protein
MSEHIVQDSSGEPTRLPKEKRKPHAQLSTIMGIEIDGIRAHESAEKMAQAYLRELEKKGANQDEMAELAWALRRQMQEDLKQIQDDGEGVSEARKKLLEQDNDNSFSLAVYRQLLKLSEKKILSELKRHQEEKENINGTYEEFKDIEQQLDIAQSELNALLAEMFKRSGQEPKPSHLMKRTVYEANILDLEEKLDALKTKSPDIAALIEYDTIRDYATQLRASGFIWTKSRKKLLQKVLTGALTSRPVVALMGETGSGKTAVARAASIELASREPERTVGGDQEKFARLLAFQTIQKDTAHYEFGPLLRAMTGRSSSLEGPSSTKGGGIFFDDEFNTRPTSVQRQILKFVSEARPGRVVVIPGTPLTVKVEPGFLYLAAGNPPSEKYEREETGIETKREFAGNVLNVEYLEQTPENPELYQILEATLLDQKTGRLTAVTPEEVEPKWDKDSATGEYHLNLDPTSGNYIWRFANAWGELFKAFSNKATVMHKIHSGDPVASWHLSSFILS